MGLVTWKKVERESEVEVGYCWERFSDRVRRVLWRFAVEWERRGICRRRKEKRKEKGENAVMAMRESALLWGWGRFNYSSDK